jgi:hypothetical protein
MKKKTETKPKKAKAAVKKPEPIKIETISARHEFDETEKSKLGLKLAELNQQKTRTEEEKKAVVSQWATKVKTIQSEIGDLSAKISSGFEMRPTECEVHFDWKTGKKTYIRISDKKVIDTQSITDPERQQKLFEEQEEKKANATPPLKQGENIVSMNDALRQAESSAKTVDEATASKDE